MFPSHAFVMQALELLAAHEAGGLLAQHRRGGLSPWHLEVRCMDYSSQAPMTHL